MKIRNGFISNSSSSSFVVVFPKRPETKEDLFQIMFGEKSPDDHINFYDSVCHLSDVVNHVFEQLNEQKVSADITKVAESLQSRYHYGWLSENCGTFTKGGTVVNGPKWFLDDDENKYIGLKPGVIDQLVSINKKLDKLSYKDEDKEQREKLWNQRDELIDQAIKHDAKKLLDDYKDSFIATFEFEDHSTIGSVCEHGDIFESSGLLCIRSSNH